MAEDDGPLFLSHGDVLGVVVPVIAEVVELSLKFMGDGEYERHRRRVGRCLLEPRRVRALVWRRSWTLRLMSGVMGDASDMCVGWVRRRGDVFMRERGGSGGKLRVFVEESELGARCM